MAIYEKFEVKVLGATGDDYKSQAFQLPEWANYTGIFIPTLDVQGDISLEWMDEKNATAAKLASDQDTDWHPVGDPTDGAGAVINVSGNDPMVTDVSVFVRALSGKGYLRIVCAGQQTSDLIFTIHCVG